MQRHKFNTQSRMVSLYTSSIRMAIFYTDARMHLLSHRIFKNTPQPCGLISRYKMKLTRKLYQVTTSPVQRSELCQDWLAPKLILSKTNVENPLLDALMMLSCFVVLVGIISLKQKNKFLLYILITWQLAAPFSGWEIVENILNVFPTSRCGSSYM